MEVRVGLAPTKSRFASCRLDYFGIRTVKVVLVERVALPTLRLSSERSKLLSYTRENVVPRRRFSLRPTGFKDPDAGITLAGS